MRVDLALLIGGLIGGSAALLGVWLGFTKPWRRKRTPQEVYYDLPEMRPLPTREGKTFQMFDYNGFKGLTEVLTEEKIQAAKEHDAMMPRF